MFWNLAKRAFRKKSKRRAPSRSSGKKHPKGSSSSRPKFDRNRWNRGDDLPKPKESKLDKARRLLTQSRRLARQASALVTHPRTVARMAADEIAFDYRNDKRRFLDWLRR